MPPSLSDPPGDGAKPPENAPPPPPTPPATAPAPEIPAPPPAAVIVTTGARSEGEIELQRQLDDRDLTLRARETECSELQDVNRSLRKALEPPPAPRKKRGIMAEFFGLEE
jgi:hypothetical protein